MAATRRALALGLLLLLALGPTPAAAAPSVETPIAGWGVASRYTLLAFGYALEGGAADVTIVCADCLLRLTLVDSSFVRAEPAGSGPLAPGLYELREYRGLVQVTGSAGRFDVTLVGTGSLERL